MNIRRILSCLLLPAYLSSCTSWQVHGVSPEQVITEESPSVVRVITTDSVEVVLEQPSIIEDSLVGVVRGPDSTPRAVALGDISSVSVQRTDPLKSVGMGLGIVLGFGVLLVGLVAIRCAADTSSEGYVGC